jgi:hypothetical protein
MRRPVNVIVLVLVFLLAGGIALSALPKIRDAADRQQCQNNLKQIGLGLHNSNDTFGWFPTATVPNKNLPAERRLSWHVDALPFMDQVGLVVDRSSPWDAEVNRVPKSSHLDGNDHPVESPLGEIKLYRCPSNPAVAEPGWPGLTHFVGLAGVGKDAAGLALGYPGTGLFGYDRKAKLEDIPDGTGNTVMVMETNAANGAWTAGGFPTARGLDPSGGPYLGPGGQFGSGHRSYKGWFSPTPTVISNVVFAEVRFAA